MKKKSSKAIKFVTELHNYIVGNPQFRKNTKTKSEKEIQSELRPLIIRYLENYFASQKYKDAVNKANKSFYWEGQEGNFGKIRDTTFGGRNYPDFIIKQPYAIAIEYKQSPNGSTVKHGIGQSIMHTLSSDFDFVYFLFHDQSKNKKIEKSITNFNERKIINRMWDEFNVFIQFV